MLKRNNTTFVRLPSNLQRPIVGGCQCPHCAAMPRACTPMWDTLAFDDKGRSWSVHFPDLEDEKRLTIVDAIKGVATSANTDEAREKHTADCQEALDEELG